MESRRNMKLLPYPIVSFIFTFLSIKDQINYYNYLKKIKNCDIIYYLNKYYRLNYVSNYIFAQCIQTKNISSFDFIIKHINQKNINIPLLLLIFGDKHFNLDIIKKYKIHVPKKILNIILSNKVFNKNERYDLIRLL